MFGGPWSQPRGRRVLRPFTLRVLYDAPKNGVEVMDAIEEMTHGRWRPSPGSVYPMLEDLTEGKVVRKRDDGRYELTPEARQEFSWPWGHPAGEPRGMGEMLREMEGYASYFEEIAPSRSQEIRDAKPRIAALAARLAKLAEA